MMIEPHKREKQKGFTLIELLVAIAILAIGLLAVASMQGVAINANSIANRSTAGNALAQQVAEERLAHDPMLIVGDTTLTTAIALPYPLDPVTQLPVLTVGPNRYTATYVITPNAVINGQTMMDTTRLDVTVSYLPPGGGAVPVGAFSTYRYVR